MSGAAVPGAPPGAAPWMSAVLTPSAPVGG